MSKKDEELFGAYVNAQEGVSDEGTTTLTAQPLIPPTVGYQKTEKAIQLERAADKMGWHKINLKTLPSGGLFYPEDTEIWIKAATGEEIKHWSTVDDTEALELNNAWNFIIERCVNVKASRGSNWRDLVDIDRLYLLLAVRELTFIDEDNNLMVPISEGNNIPVTKEMVHYIDVPEEIMKRYSPTERNFVFTLKNGKTIRVYIPTLGVNDWLAKYYSRKSSEQVGIDEDYLKYAAFLIPNYRNLTDKTYEEYVMESRSFGIREWSLLGKVVDTLRKVFMPNFKYTAEDGSEREVPINFLGGIKAIFTISDSISDFCGD